MPGKAKVVVTDYIEPELEWETKRMAELGADFKAYQLKGAAEDDVIKATADADVVVVNMVKITPSVIAGFKKCKVVVRRRHGGTANHGQGKTARQRPAHRQDHQGPAAPDTGKVAIPR